MTKRVTAKGFRGEAEATIHIDNFLRDEEQEQLYGGYKIINKALVRWLSDDPIEVYLWPTHRNPLNAFLHLLIPWQGYDDDLLTYEVDLAKVIDTAFRHTGDNDEYIRDAADLLRKLANKLDRRCDKWIKQIEKEKAEEAKAVKPAGYYWNALAPD